MTGAEPSPWALPGSGAPPERPRREPTGPADRRQAPAGSRLPVPLRALTLSDIVDGAFAVVKRRPSAILGFAAAVVVPVQVASSYGARAALDRSLLQVSPGFESAFVSSGQRLAVQLLMIELELLTLALVGAFVARMVASWYAGDEPPTAEVVRSVWRAAPSLVGAFVVVHLVELVALAMLVLPAIAVTPMFLAVSPVIAVEQAGAVAAVQRSWRLAARRYWRAVAVVVLSALVSLVIGTSFGLIPTLLAFFFGSDGGWLLLALGNVLSSVVLTPVVAAAAALFYMDVRIRTEGLDLELAGARAFGQQGP